MLKTAILNTLLLCHRAGQTLPGDLLKRECEKRLGGRIGDSDFAASLGDLQDKQLVTFIVDDYTDDRKYHLTEQGRTQA